MRSKTTSWSAAPRCHPGSTGAPSSTGLGRAEEAPLRALDRTIRDQIEARPGWPDMPAEILAGPVPDPSKFIVAVQADR